jgi:hypothetical protein
MTDVSANTPVANEEAGVTMWNSLFAVAFALSFVVCLAAIVMQAQGEV